MRAQAMEALLVRIERAWEDYPNKLAVQAMHNLVAKSKILRSRTNDAAVIRELLNKGK